MTKEELMDIIKFESTIYSRWEESNGDNDILEESIAKAFNHIIEAAEEYFAQFEE